MTATNASRDSHAFVGPAARKLVGEPALEDILSGPVVRAMMSADRVDAEALAAMLRSVASRLENRTRVARSPRPLAPAPEREFSAGRQAPACPTGAEIRPRVSGRMTS